MFAKKTTEAKRTDFLADFLADYLLRSAWPLIVAIGLSISVYANQFGSSLPHPLSCTLNGKSDTLGARSDTRLPHSRINTRVHYTSAFRRLA